MCLCEAGCEADSKLILNAHALIHYEVNCRATMNTLRNELVSAGHSAETWTAAEEAVRRIY
jgi:hypothetical protein